MPDNEAGVPGIREHGVASILRKKMASGNSRSVVEGVPLSPRSAGSRRISGV